MFSPKLSPSLPPQPQVLLEVWGEAESLEGLQAAVAAYPAAEKALWGGPEQACSMRAGSACKGCSAAGVGCEGCSTVSSCGGAVVSTSHAPHNSCLLHIWPPRCPTASFKILVGSLGETHTTSCLLIPLPHSG